MNFAIEGFFSGINVQSFASNTVSYFLVSENSDRFKGSGRAMFRFSSTVAGYICFMDRLRTLFNVDMHLS